MHRDNKKVADKLAELLANGRIMKIDWNYWIPQYLSQEPKIVKVNALNFAEGLQKALDENYIDNKPIDLNKYDTVMGEE